LLVAHLTDLHLDGTELTRSRLRRVATEIAAATAPVDLIIVTGDIIEDSAFSGNTVAMCDEYRFAHDLLAPMASVAYCPGNSDGEAFSMFMSEVFPGDEGTNHRVEANGVTFLMLDSRVPGDYVGHLTEETIAWLKTSLADASGPAVIGMHHPPVAIGHAAFDRLGLGNPEALDAVLAQSSNVVAILCGHIHMALTTAFTAVPVVIAPGVHSLGHHPWTMPERPKALIDPSAPPAFAMHRIDAGDLTTFPIILREEPA